MKQTILVLIAALAAIPMYAQKKKAPVQKRDAWEFSFELPAYVEQLKQELTYPMAWRNAGIGSFAKWKKQARAKVFECMLTPPKKAASWDVETIAEEWRDGYTARKIRFNINAYSRQTAYLLIPDGKGRHPAVNVLHDHGAHLFIGKEKMVRPFGVDSLVMADALAWADNLYEGQFLGDRLAKAGYVVLSYDAPMWGERCREEGADRNKYDIIAGNMMMLGRNLSAFMTYDDIAATDMLATLDCVDATRIGCTGCSMGAYRAWMLAALSDKVKACAAVCWMTTTDVQMNRKDGKRENGGYANCFPGLRQYMDYPDIASLACPGAMLLINGRRDHLFPIDGVEDAFAIMHSVWDSQKAGQKLETELWDVPHSCGRAIQERIVQFFGEHLLR